jgi:putative ABC transport system substrate-binding protein
MRRREFITLLGGAAWPLAARGQQTAMPVVGFLHPESLESNRAFSPAFFRGLADTGFVDGRNVTIEYKWAEGRYDRLSALADDLVRRQVSVIVALSTPAALAAKAATKTRPIVFEVGIDPVELGLVVSLNRPGGNLTGVADLHTGVAAKCLEMMHELLPRAALIGLITNAANPANNAIRQQTQAAARILGVNLAVSNAGSESEIEAAFATFVLQRADALVVSPDPFLFNQRHQFAALAIRYRLPAIFFDRVFVEAGGLMSYGTSLRDSFRQVGTFAGRILKGEIPADLPVQQATKIELVINMKTAKALGIPFPLILLGRADEVIE